MGVESWRLEVGGSEAVGFGFVPRCAKVMLRAGRWRAEQTPETGEGGGNIRESGDPQGRESIVYDNFLVCQTHIKIYSSKSAHQQKGG